MRTIPSEVVEAWHNVGGTASYPPEGFVMGWAVNALQERVAQLEERVQELEGEEVGT